LPGPTPDYEKAKAYVEGVCAREKISVAELGRRAGIKKHNMTRKLKGQRGTSTVDCYKLWKALGDLGEKISYGDLAIMLNAARKHYLGGRNE
jgi:hypothetical protein